MNTLVISVRIFVDQMLVVGGLRLEHFLYFRLMLTFVCRTVYSFALHLAPTVPPIINDDQVEPDTTIAFSPAGSFVFPLLLLGTLVFISLGIWAWRRYRRG